MKTHNLLSIPIFALLFASGTVLWGQPITIDFEDANELSTNWVQTFGQPDAFAQTATSGAAGSTGVVHVDDTASDFYVNSVYQTNLGGFRDGITLYAKVHFVQVSTNNVFNMGLITDPNGIGSLSAGETTADWMGVNLTCRSDFQTFRLVAYGYDHEPEGATAYRSGAGHPESFVPIPDGQGGVADGVNPVDVWLGIRATFIDLGNGHWDVQTTIDVLSADGSSVVTPDYAVYNYSLVGGLDDGHSTHPDLSGFTDFYNASELYFFMGTQRGAERNFAAVDEITITIPQETFVDFEDSEELANNWVQTYGSPDTFAQTNGSGVGGSTGVQYIDDESQDYQVNSVYQTSAGGFQHGLSMHAKVRFEQVSSNNVFHMGFTTDPNGVASLSTSETTADWIGTSLSTRSNLTEWRAEAYGTDHDGADGSNSVLFRSGAGHPESFVLIPGADGVNPVNLWIGLQVTLIDLGDGNWDVQTVIDILNEDGTAVVTPAYAVFNYSEVGGLDDGHTSHPALSTFSDLYNATALYPFIGSQRGAERNFAGVDDVRVFVTEPVMTWFGYALDEMGWADTGSWMGWVNVTFDPWVWNEALSKFVYVGDDSGWVYVYK